MLDRHAFRNPSFTKRKLRELLPVFLSVQPNVTRARCEKPGLRWIAGSAIVGWSPESGPPTGIDCLTDWRISDGWETRDARRYCIEALTREGSARKRRDGCQGGSPDQRNAENVSSMAQALWWDGPIVMPCLFSFATRYVSEGAAQFRDRSPKAQIRHLSSVQTPASQRAEAAIAACVRSGSRIPPGCLGRDRIVSNLSDETVQTGTSAPA